MITQLTYKPSILAFWGWTAVNVAFWITSLLDGTLHESMLQAVDYAVAQGSEIVEDREFMALAFSYISAAYFIVMTAVGALLVHKSVGRRNWALVLLFPLALWNTYESVSSPFELSRMYPGTVLWFHWVVAILGGIVWLFILVHSVRLRAKAT